MTFSLPDLDAGFSRSGVEDLDGLLEAFHFCAMKMKMPAKMLRARITPKKSLLGRIDRANPRREFSARTMMVYRNWPLSH